MQSNQSSFVVWKRFRVQGTPVNVLAEARVVLWRSEAVLTSIPDSDDARQGQVLGRTDHPCPVETTD
jgi:hypothetical protein